MISLSLSVWWPSFIRHRIRNEGDQTARLSNKISEWNGGLGGKGEQRTKKSRLVISPRNGRWTRSLLVSRLLSTGFQGFTWLDMISNGFYWVLPGFTGIYWVPLGFTGFYWVSMGLTWVYMISYGFLLGWLGCYGFNMVLLGFTGFY